MKLINALWRALALAFTLFFIGSPVFAADLPSRKSAPVPPAPASLWGGFYAGVNGGYAFDENPAAILATGNGYAANGLQNWTALPFYAPGAAVLNASGFIGGAQAGYNYEFSPFLVGVEGEADGLVGASKTATFVMPGSIAGPAVAQIGRAWDFAGLAKARACYELGSSFLVCGLGGLALAHTAVGETGYGSTLAAVTTTGGARLYAGWVAGAEVEYMIAPQWSVKLEYDHVDYGTHTAGITGFVYGSTPNALAPQSYLATARLAADIAKVGVNFHF